MIRFRIAARNRLRHGIVYLISVTIVASAIYLPQTAAAHNAGTFYSQWWQSDLTVHWKPEAAFPSGGGMRARLEDGAQAWTNLPPVMNFVRDSGEWANFAYSSCPSTYQKNGVHWENIDGAGDTLASVRRCLISTEIFTSQMRFDSSESWYSGTGSPSGSEFDLWSVASHEFGHYTGWSGHFGSGSAQCSGTIHTMCPTISKGTTSRRTLETHDVHTFSNKYP